MSTLKEITSALKEKNLPEFAEKIETIISQKQGEEEKEWSYKLMLVSDGEGRDEFEENLQDFIDNYVSKKGRVLNIEFKLAFFHR